jgi:hypothetical protein
VQNGFGNNNSQAISADAELFITEEVVIQFKLAVISLWWGVELDK